MTCDTDFSTHPTVYQAVKTLGLPQYKLTELRSVLEPSVRVAGSSMLNPTGVPFEDPEDSGYICMPINPAMQSLCDFYFPVNLTVSLVNMSQSQTLGNWTLSGITSNQVLTRYSPPADLRQMVTSIEPTSDENTQGRRYLISSLDPESYLEGMVELLGGFMRTNRSGENVLVRLSKTSPVAVSPAEYVEDQLWWDEYDVEAIGTVNVTYYDPDAEEERTTSHSIGPGASTYNMTSNGLLKNLSLKAEDLTDQTLQEYIVSLIHEIKSATDLPIGVYPNSGLVYDPTTKTWSVPEGQMDFGSYAFSYMKAGAAAVGGCCTTNAEHIRQVTEMREKYLSLNAKQVSYKGY